MLFKMGFDNKFSNKIPKLIMTFKHIGGQTQMEGYAYNTNCVKKQINQAIFWK